MVSTRPLGDESTISEEQHPELPELRLVLPPQWVLSEDALEAVSDLNELFRIEVDQDGALVLTLPPGNWFELVGGEFYLALRLWADYEAGDRVFGSNGFYQLPDGNQRAPDVSWISAERRAGIADEERGVWQAVPDFVIEVRSWNDKLTDQQAKLEMWLRNGVRLGWLVDPRRQQLWIYRPEAEPVRLERPDFLSDEAVLPGFAMDFARVWPAA